MRRGAGLLALVLATLAAPARAEGPACGAAVGARVSLASPESDPDVFVWDAAQRLGDFSPDRWISFSAIMAHTVVVRPGTRAIVTRCLVGGAHDRRTGAPRDAVGIYVASGPYRGKSGWIVISDLHGAPAPPFQAHR